MIERAIIQQVTYSRDGESHIAAAPRPDHVRALAERAGEFRFKPHRCVTCRKRDAVAIRGGQDICAHCRAIDQERDAFIVDIRIDKVHRHDDPGQREIGGYPIVFNKKSVDLGGFYEYIRPQAASRMFDENSDVRALVDHDSSRIIGRRTAGTLLLRADKRGVHASIDPPNTSSARDIYESVNRRDVTGGSFAFRVRKDDFYTEDDAIIREVLDMDVAEISVVSFPAYPDTSFTAGPRGANRSVEWLQKVHKTRLAR